MNQEAGLYRLTVIRPTKPVAPSEEPFQPQEGGHQTEKWPTGPEVQATAAGNISAGPILRLKILQKPGPGPGIIGNVQFPGTAFSNLDQAAAIHAHLGGFNGMARNHQAFSSPHDRRIALSDQLHRIPPWRKRWQNHFGKSRDTIRTG